MRKSATRDAPCTVTCHAAAQGPAEEGLEQRRQLQARDAERVNGRRGACEWARNESFTYEYRPIGAWARTGRKSQSV